MKSDTKSIDYAISILKTRLRSMDELLRDKEWCTDKNDSYEVKTRKKYLEKRKQLKCAIAILVPKKNQRAKCLK